VEAGDWGIGMKAEKLVDQFVSRMRAAGAQNLQSVILYGSAAGGEFHEEFSDLNLLCIVRDTSFTALTSLAPTVEWWSRQKQAPPLIMTSQELQRSSDVFAIELLDMQQRHRVLFGDDLVQGLNIDLSQHRVQVEYELREKLILLRKGLLVAGTNEKRLWDLMMGSVSAFTTLFRHALIALGGVPAESKREAAQLLATRIPFDSSAFVQLLDIREKKAGRKQFQASDLFSRYLAAVEQVTAAVDTMFDSQLAGEKP
jgi:hypothetical protein